MCFCNSDESIQHLFFDCHFTYYMWRLLSICFSLTSPRSVRHIFGSWLLGLDLKTKNLVITGVSPLCWAILISRNNLVFDNAQSMTYYLQVLFRGTHWLRLWAQLKRSEDPANLIRNACRRLETVAMYFFLLFMVVILRTWLSLYWTFVFVGVAFWAVRGYILYFGLQVYPSFLRNWWCC